MAQDREQEKDRPKESPKIAAEATEAVNAGPEAKQLSGADVLFADRPIGTARMLKDESIVLNLKARDENVKIDGEGVLTFGPADKNYQTVRDHLKNIKPGETKLVMPFKEQDVTGGGSTVKPGESSNKPGDNTNKPGDNTNKPGDNTPPVVQDNTNTNTKPDVIQPPSKAFSDQVDKTYNKMSKDVRDIVTDSGAQVVAPRRLTDAMPELKGQKPRGWPPGSTWDAVDGAYSPGKKQIIVSEEVEVKPGIWVKSNRTDNVLRHETGHAVNAALDNIADDTDYLAAYDPEAKAVPKSEQKELAYFLQSGGVGADETVAEGIASREGGSTGGATFDRNFANTIKVIDAKIKAYKPTNSGPAVVPVAPTATGTGAGTGAGAGKIVHP